MYTLSREPRILLVDTGSQQLREGDVALLPSLLSPRDLLVVNDAATLPASFEGVNAAGAAIEVRLLEGPYHRTTRAVLFGGGDYRTPTELRAPPPILRVGERIHTHVGELEVGGVSALSPRLVRLRWSGTRTERFARLYRAAAPVQYSHDIAALALWDVQTAFACRPWAVEMPSAARPLDGACLLALHARGVPIARLTHAAGLSATGDAALDAALPLPERYEISRETVRALADTRARGGRVVAVGTSVVRALEDCAARFGGVRAGAHLATLLIGPATQLRVADGLLTGIHMPGESHYQLLSAFARTRTLTRATAYARTHGYRMHEFGDAALFLPGVAPHARSCSRREIEGPSSPHQSLTHAGGYAGRS